MAAGLDPQRRMPERTRMGPVPNPREALRVRRSSPSSRRNFEWPFLERKGLRRSCRLVSPRERIVHIEVDEILLAYLKFPAYLGEVKPLAGSLCSATIREASAVDIAGASGSRGNDRIITSDDCSYSLLIVTHCAIHRGRPSVDNYTDSSLITTDLSEFHGTLSTRQWRVTRRVSRGRGESLSKRGAIMQITLSRTLDVR